MRFALILSAAIAFASAALIVHAQDPLPVTTTVHVAPDAPLPHVPPLLDANGGHMKIANTSTRIFHFPIPGNEGPDVVSIAPLSEREFTGDAEKAAKQILDTTFKPFVDRGELVVGGLRAVQAPPPSPLPPTGEVISEGEAATSTDSGVGEPSLGAPERRRR